MVSILKHEERYLSSCAQIKKYFSSLSLNFLGAMILVLLGGAIFFAISPLSFGVWVQVEAVQTVLLFLTALSCGMMGMRSSIVLRVPYFAMIFLLIAGITVLCFPFVNIMGLSWLGYPELGYGGSSYLMMVVLTLAFVYYLPDYATFIIFSYISIAGYIGVSTVLLPYFGYDHMLPYSFPSYIAFIALGIGASAVWVPRKRNLVLLSAFLLIVVSRNLTAMLGVFFAGTSILILKGGKRFIDLRSMRVFYQILVCMIPIGILLLEGSSIQLTPSFASRAQLNQVAFDHLSSSPTTWIWGMGWGNFNELFIKHLSFKEMSLFRDGMWNPSWDAITRVDFHSHHILLEALYSIGIMGPLLILLVLVLLIQYTKDRCIHWAGAGCVIWITLNSCWFELVATIPFSALFFASLGRLQKRQAYIDVPRYIFSSFMGVAFFILGYSGFIVFDVARHNNAAESSLWAAPSLSWASAGFEYHDYARGGLHLSQRISVFMEYISSLIQHQKSPTSFDDQWARTLIECAHQQENSTLYLKILVMKLQALLYECVKKDAFPEADHAFSQWEKGLRDVYAEAPQRTDLWVGFLQELHQRKKIPSLKFWVNVFLNKNPRDPVALWFKGLSLLGENKETAKALLKQAIHERIEAIMPISAAVKKKLSATSDL